MSVRKYRLKLANAVTSAKVGAANATTAWKTSAGIDVSVTVHPRRRLACDRVPFIFAAHSSKSSTGVAKWSETQKVNKNSQVRYKTNLKTLKIVLNFLSRISIHQLFFCVTQFLMFFFFAAQTVSKKKSCTNTQIFFNEFFVRSKKDRRRHTKLFSSFSKMFFTNHKKSLRTSIFFKKHGSFCDFNNVVNQQAHFRTAPNCIERLLVGVLALFEFRQDVQSWLQAHAFIL